MKEYENKPFLFFNPKNDEKFNGTFFSVLH